MNLIFLILTTALNIAIVANGSTTPTKMMLEMDETVQQSYVANGKLVTQKVVYQITANDDEFRVANLSSGDLRIGNLKAKKEILGTSGSSKYAIVTLSMEPSVRDVTIAKIPLPDSKGASDVHIDAVPGLRCCGGRSTTVNAKFLFSTKYTPEAFSESITRRVQLVERISYLRGVYCPVSLAWSDLSPAIDDCILNSRSAFGLVQSLSIYPSPLPGGGKLFVTRSKIRIGPNDETFFEVDGKRAI